METKVKCQVHYINEEIYITSDKKIKEGDLCLYNKNHDSKNPDWEVFQCGKIEREEMYPITGNRLLLWCKKIIAATDTSLGLPQPSQGFIEKYIKEYNKGNIIIDILVEWLKGSTGHYDENNVWHWKLLGPNVNLKNNTIIIHPVKDSWTREEVESLLFKYAEEEHAWFTTKSDIDAFNNWIEKNL